MWKTSLGRQKNSSLFTLMGIVFFLFLSACTRGQTALDSTTVSGPSRAGQTASSQSVNVVLRHNSQGSMTLLWSPSTHVLSVQSKFAGLDPETVYAAHIYNGDCQRGGRVLYELPDLQTDASGIASAATRINNVVYGIPEAGWYVDVQRNPQPKRAARAISLSCADIVHDKSITSGQPQGVTIHFGNLALPGQAEDGKAQLLLRDGQLLVKITLKKLSPRSTRRGYIWLGSCSASQHKVLYDLKPITTDAAGNGNSFTVISDVAGFPGGSWSVSYVLEPKEAVPQPGLQVASCGDVPPQ